MRLKLAIFLGKIISTLSERLSLGAGGTWPGEITLALDPKILQYFSSRFTKGIILVAGTNGKTTTSLMIKKVLESDNNRIVHNDSGANLLNGLVSACIKHASWNGSFHADYGVFEVDENTLPGVLKFIKFLKLKVIIVLLNLFRDQLDRYGEVDVIAEKWMTALREQGQQGQQNEQDSKTSKLKTIQIIANADDPLIAHFEKAMNSRPGLEAGVVYFGLEDPKLFQKQLEHATDSTFCLNCGARLIYDGIYFSHIGIWKCPKCGEKRPKPNVSTWKSPLPGLYNTYNTLAAVSVVKSLGYKDQAINTALATFTPAFGRQEEFEIDGKKVKIFLSKNPAGFNESLKTVLELGATQSLLVLNDRIPDGRDVSWIWDVDFEVLKEDKHVTEEPFDYAQGRHDERVIFVSGDRCYDMALRLKYANLIQTSNFKLQTYVEPKLKEAIKRSLEITRTGETLYILPTYSAMLEVRKILTGRKIL